jgi:hypothetical protein
MGTTANSYGSAYVPCSSDNLPDPRHPRTSSDRIRWTLGSQIPPYWTSDDESITVLSGTLCLGLGTKFDENACTDFPAGSFVFLPKGVPHFGLTKADVVQIQGTGPLKVHWVEVHTQDTSE